MNMFPIERQHLTGRVRGRPNRFGRKLTMQVEVQVLEADAALVMHWPPPPGCTDEDAWRRAEERRIAQEWKPARTIWRDATLADQFALLEQTNAAPEVA